MATAPLRRTLGFALLGATLLALSAASPALADSASITFTDAAGTSDPAVGVGRTMTLAGNSAVSKYVYVRYRPAGGAPCAPSASSDAGRYSFDDFTGETFNGSAVNGNFTLRKTGTWDDPGTFMFCVWLSSSESAPATPFVQNVTFRRPTGTISATVAPIAPLAGQTATITITGSSEAPRYVFASLRPAGIAPCAVSYEAESGSSLVDGRSVNGAFSLTATTTQSTPGNYLVCLWLAESSSDGAPVAGPQPATFTVTAAPRPCVVPAVPRFTALAPYLAALSAASCVPGAQRYTASRTYPRGTIIKTTPAPGTTLAPSAAVTLLISSGKRCRVPAARAGMRLSAARSRLRAAGCVPGGVRNVRSNRRRGTVVRFSPSSGTTLSPRAVVGIRLSRGRGR
jgi:PASTA domain